MQKFLHYLTWVSLLCLSLFGASTYAQTLGPYPTLSDPYNTDHNHLPAPIVYTRSNGLKYVFNLLNDFSTNRNMPWGNQESLFSANMKPDFTGSVVQRDSDVMNGDLVLLANGDLWGNGVNAAAISKNKYGATVSHPTLSAYSKINDGVVQFSTATQDGSPGWTNAFAIATVVKSDGTVWTENSTVCSGVGPCSTGGTWSQLTADGMAWCYDDASYSVGTSTSGGRASNTTMVCYRKTDAKFYSLTVVTPWTPPVFRALNFQLPLPPQAAAKGYTWENSVVSRRLNYLILKSGEVVSLAPDTSAQVYWGVNSASMYPALMSIATFPGPVQDIQQVSTSATSTNLFVLTTDGKVYVKGTNDACILGNGCAPLTNWTLHVNGGVNSIAASYMGLFYLKTDKNIYYKGATAKCAGSSCLNSNFNVGVVVPPEKVTVVGNFNVADEVIAHTLNDGVSGPLVVSASDGSLQGDVSITAPFVAGVQSYDLYVGAKSDGSDLTKVKTISNPSSPISFSLKDTNNVCSNCGSIQSAWAAKLAPPDGGKKLYFKVVGTGYPLTPGTVTGSDDGYPSMPLDKMTLKINAIYNGTGTAQATFDNANIRFGTRQAYTTSLVSQPANAGTVTKQGDGSFLLTSATNFVGDDTFMVSATDLSGTSFAMPANVHVDCPAPTIKGLRFGGLPVLKDGRVIVKYDAPACAKNLNITLGLKLGSQMQGNLVQSDAGMTQLPTGVNQEVSVNYSNITPNNYKIVVTMVDSVWNAPAVQEYGFAISDFSTTNFSLTSDNWSPRAYVDPMTITTTNTGAPLCTLSTKEQVARNSSTALATNPAAPLVCQLEWVVAPGGLTQSKDTDVPKLGGVLTAEGNQRIDFQISLYTDSGQKVTIKQDSKTFNAARPANPAQTLAPMDGSTMYVVPSNGGSIAKLTVDAMNGAGVLTKFQIDNGQITQFSTAKGTFSRTIDSGVSDLWARRNLTVHTQYANKESIFTETVVSVLTAPSEKTKLVLTAPKSSLDNVPTPMSVSVGVPGATYDVAVHGQWKVTLAKTAADGTLVPITDPVPTVNGVAQISAPPLNTLSPQKITAIADVVSPAEGYSKRIYSDFKPLTFDKGSALDGVLTINKSSGQAPLVGTITVKMNAREDATALKSTDFYLSNDAGATWTKVGKPDESASGRMVHQFDKGVYKVKGVFTNKNTGITSESAPIDIVSYQLPLLSVSGNMSAFAGTPVVLNAFFSPAKGQPAVPAYGPDAPVTEWQIEGNATPSLGSTLTLESQDPKVLHINVRSRSPVANPADPTVWASQRIIVKFLAVAAPKIQLTGPARAETGKVNVFTARITAPWSPATAVNQVLGEWTLPNGQVVPGLTLNWIPEPNDASADKQLLHFRAWVDGYDDKGASKTADIGVVVWQYVWPTFAWSIQQDTTYAPSIVKLDALATNPKLMSQFTNEKLTVTYTFPDNLEVQKNKGSQAQLRLANEGTYPVKLVLADTRGNSSTLTTDLLAIHALPFKITAKTSPSNALWREPVTVLARADATGGHPSDHVLSYAFAVDGVPIDTKGSSAQFTLPTAGDHVMEVTLTSRFGAVQVADFPITVIQNKPPVCKLIGKSNVPARVVTVEATCTDADGKVMGYAWWVNDSKVGSTAPKLTLALPGPGEGLSVTVQATDDSGGTGTATVTMQF